MEAPKVLVTGGGRGIGRAIALRFAREGAWVAVASRTSAEVDAVAAEIEAAGGRGLAAQMNVRDFGSVEAAVYRAIEWAGGTLDVLVNNAGIFSVTPFDKLKLDDFHRDGRGQPGRPRTRDQRSARGPRGVRARPRLQHRLGRRPARL